MPQRPPANTHWQVHDDRFFPMALSPWLYPQVLGAEPIFLGLIVVVGPVDRVDNPPLSQVARRVDLWMTRG